MNQKTAYIVAFCVVLVLSYFSLFLHLDRLNLRFWDEAPYAVNAVKMLQTGSLFVPYNYHNHPDFFNTKPPMAIWLMALSMKLGGINELAVRLPSALFGLFTIVLLFIFCASILKSLQAAIFSSLALIAAGGYMREHVARTGDMDTQLAFWLLAYSMAFFIYTTGGHKKLWMVLAWLAFTCCWFTKGPASLMAAPAVLAWISYRGEWGRVTKDKWTWLGFGVSVLVIVSYYIYRETATPGYLSEAWKIEISGRLNRFEYINEKELPFFYYITRMFEEDFFMPWVLMLLPATYFTARHLRAKTQLSEGAFFALLISFCFTVITGFTQTKASWYDASLYPAFSLLVGTGLALGTGAAARTAAIACLLYFITFTLPYKAIIERNTHEPEHYHFRQFMHETRDGAGIGGQIRLFATDPDFAMFFYIIRDEMRGHSWKVIGTTEMAGMRPGDTVAVIKSARENDVRNVFETQELVRYHDCVLLKVGNKK
jgi:4-amino-4-deoxy-L-arabinose transferase-like glycosyltransferase